MKKYIDKFKSLSSGQKIQKILGVILIVIGLAIVASVVIVPVVNKNRNKKAVEDIRSASNNEDIFTWVTAPAVDLTGILADGEAEASNTEVSAPGADTEARRSELLQDGSCIGIVIIEKIGVELAIVEGTDDETLKHSVGHLTESAGIGDNGNCVIAAHHGGYYGDFFVNIDQLENGDIIELIGKDGRSFLYSVYDRKVVKRTDWSVTDELYDNAVLTLITCVDRTQEERIIVSAIKFEP